jgi:hypothetical protein
MLTSWPAWTLMATTTTTSMLTTPFPTPPGDGQWAACSSASPNRCYRGLHPLLCGQDRSPPEDGEWWWPRPAPASAWQPGRPQSRLPSAHRESS